MYSSVCASGSVNVVPHVRHCEGPVKRHNALRLSSLEPIEKISHIQGTMRELVTGEDGRVGATKETKETKEG